MFDVGFSEILFLGIITVIVLGPEKLPEAIRYITKLKLKIISLKASLNQTLEKEFELNQLKNELNNEILQVKNLEKRMKDYFLKLENETIKLDIKRYYPIEKINIKAPYQHDFFIENLMHWSCFNLK